MSNYPQYEPLKWPPELKLAELHLKCSCPGKDNPEGDECPCCGRYEKLKTTNWPSRNITKDFRMYGGGIPAYFQLLIYLSLSMIILAIVTVSFHVYCLQIVCSSTTQCQSFLIVFKFCATGILYQELNNQGQPTMATVLEYMELGTFLYLIIATLGTKWWLMRLNYRKIVQDDKIFSQFALMIKNIPHYYQLHDVRTQIAAIVPETEICELFFLHQISQYQTKYKQLFDKYFQMQFLKETVLKDERYNQHQTYETELLQQRWEQYVHLYDEVQDLEQRTHQNNGRAIIVFNSFQSKEKVHQNLKVNEFSKFIFHSCMLFGKNTQKLHLFADNIGEPREILWKYVGESSVEKNKVRIQTTFIGVGFMVLCFMLLYFPIIKVYEQKIQNPSVGTALNLIISLGLQILAIVYRQIILKLIPKRQPSTKQSESFFVVLTTVMFHFFFYIIAPGTYYILAKQIPQNVKLKQLFIAVTTFLSMSILIAFIDLRFRLFNSKKKRILKNWGEWGKFCQIRLHEELTWPSFPIEFKLMVILNIWSFNAFYVFQIPYLLLLFVLVLFIIFWVDKKNIYKHYKMQTFLSIELELSVQKHYIIMFLICLCCGYAISAFTTWQYIFSGVMFVVSIIVNYFISFTYRKSNVEDEIRKTQTLAQVIKTQTMNPKQSIRQNLLEEELKNSFLIASVDSSRSLGSVSYEYGYQQIYESYLEQFKNRRVNILLKQRYEQIQDNIQEKRKRESEMVQIVVTQKNDSVKDLKASQEISKISHEQAPPAANISQQEEKPGQSSENKQ